MSGVYNRIGSFLSRSGKTSTQENGMAGYTHDEKKMIDEMIRKKGLNEFGDPKGTNYAGGTPLFNEMTGRTTDRYDYIVSRHRDWLPQER